jgi:hypothetical protein
MTDNKGMATYHQFAQAEADEDRGGRFAVLDKPVVTGSAPIPSVPAISDGPWSKDECPPEPSIGYCVDDQEPVGEMFEQAASKKPAVVRRSLRRI